jgi:hypothetical protein
MQIDSHHGVTYEFGLCDPGIDYAPKGVGSSKRAALGTTSDKDGGHEVYPFHPSFMNSDWKLFHDALQVHRLSILNEVLPKYGISAACRTRSPTLVA